MKGFSFDLLVRIRLLDLLWKYIQGDIPGHAEPAPNDGLEHKKTVIFAYWIPDCHLAMNQYSLQPQTVSIQWRHIPNDPARMSSKVYKNLPRV